VAIDDHDSAVQGLGKGFEGQMLRRAARLSNWCRFVMTGHNRPKDGVASLAYVLTIPVFGFQYAKDVDARHEAGHEASKLMVRH
jgi:hypothetical protein